MEDEGVLWRGCDMVISNGGSESDLDSGDASEVDEDSSLPAEDVCCIRYRDVSLYALPSHIPGAPNIPTAKVTLSHTTGTQRLSQSSACVSPSPNSKHTHKSV